MVSGMSPIVTDARKLSVSEDEGERVDGECEDRVIPNTSASSQQYATTSLANQYYTNGYYNYRSE
jgi:hypothetical protein